MKIRKIYMILALIIGLTTQNITVYAAQMEEGYVDEVVLDTSETESFGIINHQDTATIINNVLVSNNIDANERCYHVAHPAHSNLTLNADGTYTRVEYIGDGEYDGKVYIEKYSSTFELLSHFTIEPELPIWGGFYDDGTYFYLVFGQENLEEDDEAEVIRVVKYDKNWNRLGAAMINDANIVSPIAGGTIDMDVQDGLLYIRTARTMYKIYDGRNHQSACTLIIRISDMSVQYVDQFDVDEKYGHVSHSFDQYVVMDGGDFYALDQCDANPYRAAVITKVPEIPWKTGYNYYTRIKQIPVLEYSGEDGDNYMASMLGGFAVSDTHCIVVGASRRQDIKTPQDGYYTGYNAYIAATTKDSIAPDTNSQTKIQWLTEFSMEGNQATNNPQLVEINKNLYALFWQEVAGDLHYYTETNDYEWYSDEVDKRVSKMVYVDGTGTIISEPKVIDANFSDCQPIYNKSTNQIVWYVTDGIRMRFHVFDVQNNTLQNIDTAIDKTLRGVEIVGPEGFDFQMDIGESVQLTFRPIPEIAEFEHLEADWSCWDKDDWGEDVAVIDENGIITALGEGETTISLTARNPDNYIYYKDSIDIQVQKGTGNSGGKFVDVKPGAYYEIPVNWAVENGVTTGTSPTTFSPDEDCTRGQIVTFLWRAAGSPEPISAYNPFVDVSENTYYYKAVLWAAEKGITTGTSPNTFSPFDTCTRGQCVTFLCRYAGASVNDGVENPFVDVNKDTYYYKPVLWAVNEGITTGTSPITFSPNENCTRGQIVTFLYRYAN